MIGIRTGEQPGSCGLSWEATLDAAKQYVLSVELAPARGRWSLRLDAGNDASARWFACTAEEPERSLRIAGVGSLRVMAYSDDAGAEAALRRLEIRPAADDDWNIPMAMTPTAAELAQSRALWLPSMGLTETGDTVAIAKAAASFVYRRSRVTGPDATQFRSFGSPGSWVADPAKTIDGSCGNFALAMVDLCTQLGVHARIATIATSRFAAGLASGDTHVLVEVFDPESRKWVLLDPTFNTAFRGPGGELVGLKELFRLASAKLKWVVEPIGPLRPGRSIQEYYLTYEDLLFVVDAPAVPALGDNGCEYRSQQTTVDEIGRKQYPSASGR